MTESYDSISRARGPSSMDGPDLSHLTPEERAIIQGVMQKQQQEESREISFLLAKQHEVISLEQQIKAKAENQKKAGVELEATCQVGEIQLLHFLPPCQVCLKTKFADGIGHLCNYCSVRCCARCGGKVTLRSNKVIWVCILCRKKQELLIKSGKWMHGGVPSNNDPILRKMELDMAPTPGTPSSSSIGPSASISSLFSKALLTSALTPGTPRSQPGTGHYLGSGHHPDRPVYGGLYAEKENRPSSSLSSLSSVSHRRPLLVGASPGPRPGHAQPRQALLQQQGPRGGPRGRPPLTRAASEGGEEAYDCAPATPGSSVGDARPPMTHNVHQALRTTGNRVPTLTSSTSFSAGFRGRRPGLYQQGLEDSYSYSAPEDHSNDGPYNLYPRVLVSEQEAHDKFPSMSETDMKIQKCLLDPNAARVSTSRRKLDSTFRNDSLSSDQSEYQSRPPPPRPHKHKKVKHQHSISSSDEEIRSTPDCTSCGEEFESESISEKEFSSAMLDRFHREELLDAKIKNFLAHPVSWQPSSDRKRNIGHMILKKCGAGGTGANGSTLLGLKVVGGKLLPNKRYGAIIEKVKKGSIADTVGNLLPGDEVLEWNGRSLQAKSYEEVHDIIAESRQEEQVELIVSRPVIDPTRPLHGDPRVQRHNPHHNNQMRDPGALTRGDGSRQPTLAVTDPLGGTLVMRQNSPPNNPGCRLQVKTLFSQERLELVVSIITAVGLQSKVNGQYRNPYAKIFLLPDRSEKSKRRTKTISNTNNPTWNQSFVYSPIRITELSSRILEVTVWDFDRFGANDFLGEVTIDLAHAALDEEPEWYHLNVYKNGLPEHLKQSLFSERDYTVPPTDHLSPPSTTNRLSDSEISEGDYNEESYGASGARERKGWGRGWQGQDAASLSGNSIGSSSSPPPDQEYGARRDVSPKQGGAIQKVYPGGSDGGRGRRRLPQIPPRGYEARGRGGFFSMDRGRRQVHGRPQPGYKGHSGYSDTEMLNERHDDQDTTERHRQRLEVLRHERDQGVGVGGGLPRAQLATQPSNYAMSEPGGYREQGARGGYSDTSSQPGGFRGGYSNASSQQRMFSDTASQPGGYNKPGFLSSDTASQPGGFRPGLSDTSSQPGGYRDAAMRPGVFSDTASQPGGYQDLPRDVGRFTDTASQPGGYRELTQRPLAYTAGGQQQGAYQGYRGDWGSNASDAGGYMSDRGGYSTRGAYQSERGGYVGDRGGYTSDRGGYSSDRGGYTTDRGGHPSDRGGYGRGGATPGWSRVNQTQNPPPQQARSWAGESVVSSSALTTPAGGLTQEDSARVATSVQFSAKSNPGSKPLVDTAPTSTTGGSLPKSILRMPTTTSPSNMEPADGSISDSAVGNSIKDLHKRVPGMGKKSNSTSQLSDTGRQRRLGLIGQRRTTITVHRSEEVIPVNVSMDRKLVRQGTSVSSDGEPDLFPDTVSESWLTSTSRDGALSEFIEGLGPGQLVGRQVLGSPLLGDIQLSMCDKRGNLEVEVIRARGLQSKAGSKVLPAPWVKVYLVSGKKCLSKAKTASARRTLDPLFQQQLVFHERYGGCVLQVTVWGDYGRVEGKKVFMGVAQIMLDDLDLSNIVIGWYKLFGTSSLVSVPPGGGKDKKKDAESAEAQLPMSTAL